jgi:hypothetical protein
MPESIQFTAVVELNQAISRNAGINAVTLAYSFCIYKSSYRLTRKYGKTPRRVTGYYITTPGIKPSEMPGGNSKWYTILVKDMPSTVNTRQTQ